jgi:hypothetical protein
MTVTLWVERLAVAAVLVASALAQDSGSTPVVSPPASTQTAASVLSSAPGATAGSPDPASPPPDAEAGVFVFRKKVEEVTLRAVVVDQQNHLISKLDRNAFSVYEDGKLQKMTSFRQENVPLALGLLIDNSGSMRPKRQKVNQAVLNLVRSSNPGDEVFVEKPGEARRSTTPLWPLPRMSGKTQEFRSEFFWLLPMVKTTPARIPSTKPCSNCSAKMGQ